MTYLTAHLPFPSSSSVSGSGPTALPPPGSHLLITDTLASPGTFTLYHLVHAAVNAKTPVTWVDFRCQGKKSIEAVLRRMGVALPKNETAFVHIQPRSFHSRADDPPQETSSIYFSPTLFGGGGAQEPTIKPTFDAITRASNHRSMIILDGLSDLLDLGFSGALVHRFVRALQRDTRQNSGILVSTLRADDLGRPSLEQDLLERLMRSASGWWRIEELSTGRSGDVHGEISSHALFPCPLSDPEYSGTTSWTTVPKSQPLQYRLEVNTVKVFPKGTGRGYL